MPEEYPLRIKSQACYFDAKIERGTTLVWQNPQDWYRKWNIRPLVDVDVDLLYDDDEEQGSHASNKKGIEPNISIWFTLEYNWKDLKICHLLHPMHIFKNVGHSLWKHLVGIKDTHAS